MRIQALSNLKGSLVGFFRGDPNISKFKARGLRVGSNFNMLGGCIIDHSHCCLITIGDNVTFAPRVHVYSRMMRALSMRSVIPASRSRESGTMSSWAPLALLCRALQSVMALLLGREAL